MKWTKTVALAAAFVLATALVSCSSNGSTEVAGSPPSTSAASETNQLPTQLVKSIPREARDIAFAPDGSAAYAATDRKNEDGEEVGVLVQYDPETLTEVDSFDVGPDAEQVLISPDSQLAYVASANATTGDDGIWVIDLNTKATLATIDTGKSSSVRNMVLSADGSTLYATDWISKNRVFVINTRSNRVEKTIDVDMQPEGLALSPDETKLALAADNNEKLGPDENDPVVAIIDPSSGEVRQKVPVPTGASVVQWVNDTIVVAGTANDSSSIVNVSTDTFTITSTVDIAGSPFAAAVYSNQEDIYFAIFAEDENSTPIYSITEKRVTAAVAAGGEAYGIAVRPDGEQVWIANWAGGSIDVVGR